MSASLRSISAAASLSAGQRASRALSSWAGFARATQVVAFSSLPGEMDTRPFMESARDAGKAWLLPRVVAETLEFVSVGRDHERVRGRFGVLEPGPTYAAEDIEADAIVLVPGLAFDRAGGRLGRGAGYYDRALTTLRRASAPPTLLGLGFSLQIIDRVPMTPDDVWLDGVLTETGLSWADAERGPLRDRASKDESGSAGIDDES